MKVLLRWRRAARERMARHAERITHLDRLGQAHSPESPHQLTPWEELFARPEWRETTAGHDGRCACCGAAVGLDQTHCGGCGAVWHPSGKTRNRAPYVVFWSVAITVSIAVSLTVARLFGQIAYRWFAIHYPSKVIDSDLVSFGQTYLLVSGALLILLFFTYVLEKLDFGGKGFWQCPPADGHDLVKE